MTPEDRRKIQAMIGFKVSKRTGQMYLTFKPRFQEPEIAQYSDFLNFSDMSFGNIDPVVESAADAMGKQMAAGLTVHRGKYRKCKSVVTIRRPHNQSHTKPE